VVAGASLAWPRLRRGKTVRPAALLRVLFPPRVVRSPSTHADLGLFLFNTFPAGVLLGWAIASANQIAGPAANLLTGLIGPGPEIGVGATAGRVIATVALFLAYELGYWLDHMLCHRVPLLWEFHKVHHTAETLSPLTVFRVHPVDSLLFANIVAVAVGLTAGVLHYLFGHAVAPFALSGSNLILVGFVFLTVHLQHSHIWISFTGIAGRVLMSPAHHQIHHSADPAHFNRNFGSCLSVWDWAFGTLHMPATRREALRFGAEVGARAPAPHSVAGVLVAPFAEAAAQLTAASPAPRSYSTD
jgi:sterol desaturase/sphingolipid hydroxylase (fatty acid hydroxylase superfamily)